MSSRLDIARYELSEDDDILRQVVESGGVCLLKDLSFEIHGAKRDVSFVSMDNKFERMDVGFNNPERMSYTVHPVVHIDTKLGKIPVVVSRAIDDLLLRPLSHLQDDNEVLRANLHSVETELGAYKRRNVILINKLNSGKEEFETLSKMSIFKIFFQRIFKLGLFSNPREWTNH